MFAFAAAGSGCASMNNTEKGAIGGGVVGTALGTAVGAATGHTGAGAVIGGLAGTATGALVGNDIDKQERRDRDINQAAALAAAQQQQQRMGMFDVIRLAQGGHDDTVIINQIRTTGSTFQLTASDLDELKRAGVSSRVIAEMQAARPAPARVIVRDGPPVVYDSGPPVYVRPAPVVVVGPPRPYYYGYGGGYYRRW
ncbi:glycine zipper domain-containing protein [Gemmata massiliana]|uniref:glycine zipper domain-containing protein n=1 Tax=Gemmata massiliana TaxID=1210884 RepID=UPI0013A6B99D|nr:glycine zipper domain-containing protein [Gemmata massiliana]